MDKLDKILLQYLPDTGLCARGRRIQADRRARMKAAIQLWFIAEYMPRRPVPSLVPGGTCFGNLIAVVGEREGPELIIDEMQLDLLPVPPTPPPDRHLPSLSI